MRSPTILIVVFTLLAALAPPASGQACTSFVNATDGDDSNPGSQNLPWRSIEFAFEAADNGESVCVTAGEYFYGDDADGIDLDAGGKSVDFVLRSFAGESEVRLSEKFLRLDTGTGTVRFLADTADRLVLGVGIVNSDDPAEPALLNFVHSLELVSGTLDVSAVTFSIEESVGNAAYVNPDNDFKTAPADASIHILNGRITGDPVWSTVNRTYIYGGTGTSEQQALILPASLGQSVVRFTQSGTVTFSQLLAVTDATLQFNQSGAIVFRENVSLNAAETNLEWTTGATGDISFESDLRITSTSAAPVQLAFSGDGDVAVNRLVSVPGLNMPQSATIVYDGNEQLRIDRVAAEPGTGSGPLSLAIENHSGLLQLGTPGQTLAAPGPIDNRDRIGLTGPLALRPATAYSLSNSGDIDLGAYDLIVQENGTRILNSGDMLSSAQAEPRGVIRIAADASLEGDGSISDLTVASGVLDVVSLTITGALSTISGGRLDLPEDALLEVAGNVQLNAEPSFVSSNGSIELVGENQRLTVTTDGPFPRFVIAGSTVSVGAGSTVLPGIRLASGALHADMESDLDVAGLLRIEGGSASVVSSGTLRFLSGASLTSGLLHIESPLPVSWDGPLEYEDGSLDFVSPGLAPIDGSSIDLSGAASIALQGILLGGSDAEVRIATSVILQSDLFLSSGVLIFNEDGSLAVSGDVVRTSGRFEPTEGAFLSLNGSTSQVVSGFSASVLPSLRLEGADVFIGEPLTVLGDVEILTGSTTVSGDVLINIDGAFIQSDGLFRLAGSPSIFASDGFFFESGTFEGGTGSMRSAGDVLFASPALSVDGVEMTLDGVGDLLVDVQTDVSLRSLTVRTGTRSLFEGPGILDLSHGLAIRSDAELRLDETEIRMTGASGGARVTNAGRMVGSGFVRLVGPSGADPFVLSGGGQYGALSVELTSGDAAVNIADMDTLRVSGTVRFLSGGIDAAGRPVRLVSGAETPGIILNLEGGPDGRGFFDSTGPLDLDTDGGLYDLAYLGSLTAPHAAGTELLPGRIRNLSIAAPDAVNSPPVFGVSLNGPTTLPGELHVSSSSLLRLTAGSLTLSGASAFHRINGRIVGDFETRFEGGGSTVFSTDSTAFIRSMTIASPMDAEPIELIGFPAADRLHIDNAPVNVRGSRRLSLATSLTMDGGQLSVGTGIEIGTASSNALLDARNADILLDNDSHIRLPFGGDIRLDETVTVNLSPAADAARDGRTGFVILGDEASLHAPAGIPRLLLNPAVGVANSDDVFLTGDLAITDALIHTNGDLFLGSHVLRLDDGVYEYNSDGSAFDGGRDEIAGDLTAGGGLVEIAGGVDFLLGSDLLIQSSTMIVDAPGDLVRLVSTTPEPRELHVSARPLELRAGTIDLGANDLRVSGSSQSLLVLADVDVIGSGNPAVRPDAHPIVAADGGAFAFRDADFGEIVVGGSGNASIAVTRPVTLPSLRVDGTVRLPASNEPLTVERRLVFGRGGASILGESASDFRLAGGSIVVRRGDGTLARAPVFEGPIDVFYDLGNGDLTGIDTGFEGVLTTGLELPAAVGRLGVLAGGRTDGPANRVTLSSDLSVGRLLAIYSGEFDRGGHSVVLADDALLAVDQIDADAPAVFLGDADWSSEGEVDIFLGARIERIDPDAALLPASISIDSLVVILGRPGGPGVTVRQRIPLAVNDLLIEAPGSAGTYRFDGTNIFASRSVDVRNAAMLSSSFARLETGADLLIDAGARLSGSVDAHVDGDVMLDGHFGGLSLSVAGHLTQSGTVAPSTRLTFIGSEQTWQIPAALQTGTLELDMVSPAEGPPVLRLVSGSGATGHLLAVSGTLHLTGGLLDAGDHRVRLDGPGSGYERNPEAGSVGDPPSHVVGAIVTRAEAGMTGSIVFPVGDDTAFLPLTLTFDAPLLSDTDLEVRQHSLPYSSRNGLPVASPDGLVLRDAAGITWNLTSSVNFAQSQPVTITASLPEPVAGDPESHRLLQRAGYDLSAPWHAVEGSPVVSLVEEGLLVRSVGAPGLLMPGSVTLGIGVPDLLFSREGGLQIVNMAPGAARDVLLAGERIIESLGPGSATGTISVGLGESGSEPIVLGVRDAGKTTTLTAIETTIEAGLVTIVGLTVNDVGQVDAHVSRWDRSPTPDPDRVRLGFMQLDPAAGALHIARDPATSEPLYSVDGTGSFDGPVLLPVDALLLIPVPGGSDGAAGEEFRIDLSAVAGSSPLLVTADASLFSASIGTPFLAIVAENGSVQAGTIVTSADRLADELPGSFRLGGNYPNPFSRSTSITFDLPESADVHLVVADMLGRVVRRVEAGRRAAGSDRLVRFDADGLAAGVYIYRLEAQSGRTGHVDSGTMVIVR